MNSFDDTVNKAKDFLDAAVKKTGDFVSVSKLKLQLTATYNKLDKAYAALGRLEFIKLKNDELSDPEISEAVLEIKGLMAEVKALRNEIDAAEGKIACPKCGERSPAGSTFCNGCGFELSQTKND